ncbi:MAG: hypothetical protein NT062_33225 [Proteobacteria bacterium]|nr:hypothetical protein [Pseudomonadota bacterium]
MTKKMFKVLTPVERDHKTYWVRSGTAFTNKDDSINIHLDVLPVNGKLQLRDFDEEDRRSGANEGGQRASFGGARPPATSTDTVPF